MKFIACAVALVRTLHLSAGACMCAFALYWLLNEAFNTTNDLIRQQHILHTCLHKYGNTFIHTYMWVFVCIYVNVNVSATTTKCISAYTMRKLLRQTMCLSLHI